MKILNIISNFNIYYFRHACNVMSHSAFFTFVIISQSTFCPIRRLLLLTLCPSSLFPIDIFYHSTFFLSTFCPIQRFVRWRFFYRRQFYFHLMSVNRNGDKTVHKSGQKVMTVFNAFGCFVWKTTGCLSFWNVKFYDSDVLQCTVMKLEYITI